MDACAAVPLDGSRGPPQSARLLFGRVSVLGRDGDLPALAASGDVAGPSTDCRRVRATSGLRRLAGSGTEDRTGSDDTRPAWPRLIAAPPDRRHAGTAHATRTIRSGSRCLGVADGQVRTATRSRVIVRISRPIPWTSKTWRTPRRRTSWWEPPRQSRFPTPATRASWNMPRYSKHRTSIRNNRPSRY